MHGTKFNDGLLTVINVMRGIIIIIIRKPLSRPQLYTYTKYFGNNLNFSYHLLIFNNIEKAYVISRKYYKLFILNLIYLAPSID